MPATTQRHLRILLVENHQDSRAYLALYLEGSGHAVTAVASMQEALREASRHDYDVLLSDIGLPDGDGWQLLERARFSRPIFAIAMSGFGMNTDRERSRQAGYRHHLLKPLEIEKLDAMLAEVEDDSSVHSGKT